MHVWHTVVLWHLGYSYARAPGASCANAPIPWSCIFCDSQSSRKGAAQGQLGAMPAEARIHFGMPQDPAQWFWYWFWRCGWHLYTLWLPVIASQVVCACAALRQYLSPMQCVGEGPTVGLVAVSGRPRGPTLGHGSDGVARCRASVGAWLPHGEGAEWDPEGDEGMGRDVLDPLTTIGKGVGVHPNGLRPPGPRYCSWKNKIYRRKN